MDPIIRPIGDWWDTKPPEPIIWRDPARAEKGDQVDAVLSTGEVALLSGAGNIGKSTFTHTGALGGCHGHRKNTAHRVRAAGSDWRCSADLGTDAVIWIAAPAFRPEGTE